MRCGNKYPNKSCVVLNFLLAVAFAGIHRRGALCVIDVVKEFLRRAIIFNSLVPQLTSIRCFAGFTAHHRQIVPETTPIFH